MEIGDIDKAILDSFDEEQISTLKIIADRIAKAGHSASKQTVWFASRG